MADWKEYKVSTLLDSKSLAIGDGYRAKNSELSSSGFPFARVGNINEGFNFANADYFPTENISKVGEKISQVGDIVFTSKGTVGRFAFVDDSVQKFVYSPQLCYWRTLNENLIQPRFLFYWMQGREFYSQVDAVKGQTDMADYVSLTDQRQMKITLPPLAEQQAIAEVLSSLDNKIDLLHRQNKTLEALAETLFRQWFVEEAEESWEIGTIEDEFIFTMGQSPLGSSLNEDGNGMIFFQGRTDFSFRFPEQRIYTTEPNRLAKKFDTLVSVRAPVGDMNIAIEDCCIGRGVAAFRYKFNSDFNTYTYYKLRSLMAQIKLFEDSGTVFGSIGKDDFKELENIIPPKDLVQKFQNKAKPLDEKIYQNTVQINSLTKLRDTLLPKLMSGDEVRVKSEK